MSTPSLILSQGLAGIPASPAGQVSTIPSPTVATAMPTFTPLTVPHPRATGGQIAVAVITSALVVLFVTTTLMAAGIYSMKSKDLTKTQEKLNTVQQGLQEVQGTAR